MALTRVPVDLFLLFLLCQCYENANLYKISWGVRNDILESNIIGNVANYFDTFLGKFNQKSLWFKTSFCKCKPASQIPLDQV